MHCVLKTALMDDIPKKIRSQNSHWSLPVNSWDFVMYLVIAHVKPETFNILRWSDQNSSFHASSLMSNLSSTHSCGKAIQTFASTLSMTNSVGPLHHDIVNNLVPSAASNLKTSLTIQSLNSFGWLRKGAWPVWNFLTSHWTPLCWIKACRATRGMALSKVQDTYARRPL